MPASETREAPVCRFVSVPQLSRRMPLVIFGIALLLMMVVFIVVVYNVAVMKSLDC